VVWMNIGVVCRVSSDPILGGRCRCEWSSSLRFKHAACPSDLVLDFHLLF
jgi:hypothetical protein